MNAHGSADAGDLRFSDEKEQSRFALYRGDDLVSIIDYRDDGRTVALVRVYTVPPFRGQGLVAVVVDRAVADIEARGDREVVPVCWYASDWFAAHAERAGVLHTR